MFAGAYSVCSTECRVANDLLLLEMQLAMVGNNNNNENRDAGSSSVASHSRLRRTKSSNSRTSSSQQTLVSHATRRTQVNVVAPPGKLGIILANKADSKGTVVSGVRTSSVLVDKISPGDRIVGIDGEDVSRMTVSEITTIMSRKADYERTLTVLTMPQAMENAASPPSMTSPTSAARSPTSPDPFDPQQYAAASNFSQYRR